MELDFYKLNLCGNDFILFNFLSGEVPSTGQSAEIAKKISNRGTGAGSNGVIFLSRIRESTVRMRHFNYAGVEQMSYDASLCTAKFIFDYGIQGSRSLTFETGNDTISVESIDSRTFMISTGIPAVEEERNLTINEKVYSYTPVNFRDQPGASFFFLNIERLGKEDIADTLISETLHNHPPRAVFTTVYSNEEIKIEAVMKRSVKDLTFAAAVAGTASVSNNFCDNEILVDCKGGALFFQWKGNSEKVYLTGKPEYVYKGTYYYDESDT